MKAISPSIWGPSGWSVLHRLSFCFRNAQDAATFYRSLQQVLPCPKCRRNMGNHLIHLPLPTRARDYPRWVWKLHHRVNNSTLESVTFENTDKRYGKTTNCHETKECEATFLLAIAETWDNSEEYTKALRVFMELYLRMSNLSDEIGKVPIESRGTFKKWIQKLTNTKQQFSRCSA